MRLFRPALAAALALATLPAALAAGRPITHEDLWTFARLSPPALSHDGTRAAVVVTQPAYDPTQQSADLWLLPTDGTGTPRQLTFSKAAEAGPVFSPDGAQLAFTVQREGDTAPQVYVLDLEQGGEPRRVTSISTGARTPQFSPDGSTLLFVSTVFPGTMNDADNVRIAAERKARKDNVRVYTGFPIRNWDRWLDDRQQRLFVVPVAGGEAKDLLAGSELVKQPGFGGRFSETGEEIDATWTPDGEAVVFSATVNRHRAAFANVHTDLYRVPATGGEAKRLTGTGSLEAQDSYGRPQFSADGRHLVAQFTPRTDRVYNSTRLATFAWPAMTAGATVGLPKDLAVSSFGIDADSRTLWMTAEEDGHETLFTARIGDTQARRAFDMDRGVYTGLQVADAARGVLVANFDSATNPPEVVRINPRSGHRPLSAFNSAKAAELDLAPVEHYWFDSTRGARIHNMLVKPAGFDPAKRYPVFVLIHGGPHIMWRDTFFTRWNYHLVAGTDRVVLLTNYTGSTGFGEAFAQGIQGDPFEGPANEINQAVDVAIERFGFIDGTRQCAGGASYGGHLANWLQGTTTRYRCLVSHAGLVNSEAQWGTSDTIYGREQNAGGPVWERGGVWVTQNPMLKAANFKTPVLVTIGELDYRVPVNNVIEYWSLLQRQQVESRLLVFPDENHWILKGENSRTFYRELESWLDRWEAAPAN
ncbi:MAG: prolyl oligopeptidase family serine peptidase [Lysobacteraceae bacterium]|jgi:dipeptidyl aminopeptidase/acylaminoacyl peptidase|nr:S9 family peptidase [Silanimonas sp.]